MTPRIPLGIRDRARGALRHYPSTWDMDRAAHHAPSVFESRNQLDDVQVFIIDGIEKTK